MDVTLKRPHLRRFSGLLSSSKRKCKSVEIEVGGIVLGTKTEFGRRLRCYPFTAVDLATSALRS